MNLKEGDLVTRKSYQHDIVFKITKIDNETVYLKGKNIRLYADSDIVDFIQRRKWPWTRRTISK